MPVREQALATRLQTRIQDEAAAAMRNAQSLYNRANMEQYMAAPMQEPRKPPRQAPCSPDSPREATPFSNGEAIGDSWRAISGNRNLPEEPPQAPEGLPGTTPPIPILIFTGTGLMREAPWYRAATSTNRGDFLNRKDFPLYSL